MGDRDGLRVPVLEEHLHDVSRLLVEALQVRLDMHGTTSYASTHELLGSMVEEQKEFLDAVHANDAPGVVNELIDIGVVVMFGLASALAVADKGHSLAAAGVHLRLVVHDRLWEAPTDGQA